MRVLVPATVVLGLGWLVGWLPLWPALLSLGLAIAVPAAAGFALSGAVAADLRERQD